MLLEVKDLKTHFFTDDGVVKAVDGVSFNLGSGEVLGLVGESGCGKTVTALSIMRLIPSPPGRIVGGEIIFGGQDLAKTKEAEMCQIRGNGVGMIFQEPMTSLNPLFTIGNQIMEPIIFHQKKTKVQARALTLEMLRMVEIPSPDLRINEYPHQLSGGMKQRAMIALALSCRPQLLIADEPTTALDVTIQAGIIELLLRLKEELGMSILLITHDLGVVAEMAQSVAVMYASKIVEYAGVREIFKAPKHPYTIGLLNSLPKLGVERERLDTIPGQVPNPLNFPSGCKFWPRCPFADEDCRRREPHLEEVAPSHKVRCFKTKEVSRQKWRQYSQTAKG
ncbi:Dipeptide transport ATP-binding protein DppD [subsurface metagenome]